MALKTFNPQLKALTKTPQRKTYTVALVTITIVVLMIFLAIRPAIVSIFDRLNENEEKMKLLQNMDQKYQAIVSLNRQEQSYSDELDLLNDVMPDKREEFFIEANLAKMASMSGLSVVSLSVNKDPRKSVIKEEVLQNKVGFSYLYITVLGDKKDLVRFIELVENFPRPLNIATYSYVPDNDGKAEIRASIEIEFYYYL